MWATVLVAAMGFVSVNSATWSPLDQAKLTSIGGVFPSPDGDWSCHDEMHTSGIPRSLCVSAAAAAASPERRFP